jgi:uncharacterized SAM-binding protein YcdF (DUF218 family)
MTWLLLACGAALGVLALPYIATHLLRSLEAYQPLTDLAVLDGVGAIVVLSADFMVYAPEMGGATVGPLTLQRLHYAARLHKSLGAPLLVTGGHPLADRMAEVLDRDFGQTVQWLDRSSRNTRESARKTKALLEPLGIDRICLVTHGFHMVRANREFVRQGFVTIAAPTLCWAKPAPLFRDFIPGHTALSRSLLALREWCARAFYTTSAWCDDTYTELFRHRSPVEHRQRCAAHFGVSSPSTSRINDITRSNPGSDE